MDAKGDAPDPIRSAVADLLEQDPRVGCGQFVVTMRRRGIDPAAALDVLPVLLGFG
jgi:hypothetical protein